MYQKTKKISIVLTVFCLCCLFTALSLLGCLSPQGAIDQGPPVPLSVPEDKILVFFIRNANFYGKGRTHILKIDNKPIGPLTGDNYYRLEMWPGEYQFAVSLPEEEFFGQISLPDNISRQITLKGHPEGRAYTCAYTDGQGSSGLALTPVITFPEDLVDRTLAKDLTARDTAQVTEAFDAQYDGPALYGRPHGQGTLSWPDGSRYRGIFLHGDPTRRAQFSFPDGQIFMGPFVKGRPANNGLLMNPTGDIIYSGNFTNEQPEGVGIRSGLQGPEFCIYESGSDITKTFRQLAKEALDIEDPQAINAFLNRVEDIAVEIEAIDKRMTKLSSRHDPDRLGNTLAQLRNKIKSKEKQKRSFELNMTADNETFVKQLQDTRYKRELAKAKAFRKSHQAEIDKERKWCEDEFAQGRNLCICAPFAKDFQKWEACWEPLRPRYID